MAVKIVLIGMLLPLHHYLEERVVHYLTNHKLIDSTRLTLKWSRKKTSQVAALPEEEAISNN